MSILSSLSSTQTPAAVRIPTIEINLGAGGSGGGLSGLAGSLSGGSSVDPWARSLVSVSTQTGLTPGVDTFELQIADDCESPPVGLADQGSVSLGYGDSSVSTVFSGAIADLNFGIGGVKRIEVMNGGSALVHLRINQAYEQLSTGDVVSDLLSQAGVDTETVEAGFDLPYFVIDDRRNALDHIALLARRNGFVAYFTVENKLYFGPAREGEAAQRFTYGLDIIHLKMTQTEAVLGPVTVVGAGAAGSQGKEAWPWLVKDPSALTVEAGDGAVPRLRSDPALRSSEAIQAAADGLADAYGRRALHGRIHVPGAPEVVVGSTIDISDAPQEALNGSFWVCRVRHDYSKHHGFISIIDFSSTGEGGLL